jgi:hypothetical protein
MAGDAWLVDALDALGSPDVVRGDWVVELAEQEGMKPAEARARLSVAIGRVGYQNYNNPGTKDGRWKINKKNVMVYVKSGVAEPNMDALHKERF